MQFISPFVLFANISTINTLQPSQDHLVLPVYVSIWLDHSDYILFRRYAIHNIHILHSDRSYILSRADKVSDQLEHPETLASVKESTG